MTEIDQFQLVLQFCVYVAALLTVSALGIKLSEALARPRAMSRATYGAGLPERRVRPRTVITDPVAARLREVISNAA